MRFEENLATLEPVDSLRRIDIVNYKGEVVAEIPNEEGKRGSLQVYANILDFNNGQITHEMATKGVRLFAEYSDEANLSSYRSYLGFEEEAERIKRNRIKRLREEAEYIERNLNPPPTPR